MQSNDNLPINLVLLYDGKLIGHVRLSGVIGEPSALFLTSVIVSPDFRGKGLGRKLLLLTEEYALSKGYHALFLTSDEKEKFYEKCGFHYCQPVQQCHGKSLQEKIISLQKNVSQPQGENKTVSAVPLSSVETKSSARNIPPPPPLPSPPVSQGTRRSNENKQFMKTWMKKDLKN